MSGLDEIMKEIENFENSSKPKKLTDCFFKLTSGQTAMIQLLFTNKNEIKFFRLHTFNEPDDTGKMRFKKYKCIGRNCTRCDKEPAKVRVFVPVYQKDVGVRIWEVSPTFFKERLYEVCPDDLTKKDSTTWIKVRRNGEKLDTTYSLKVVSDVDFYLTDNIKDEVKELLEAVTPQEEPILKESSNDDFLDIFK